MKLLISFLLICVVSNCSAQMKRDTTNKQYHLFEYGIPNGEGDSVPLGAIDNRLATRFDDFVFLMQQNKELSDRLDRLEDRIDSLEHRPYLFIDVNCSRPGVWLTNSAGEYQIFITPINYK